MHCSTDAKKDALEEDANETPVCTMYLVSWFHCSYVIDTYCLKEVEAKVEKFYSSIKSRLLVSEVVARIQVFPPDKT